jgi:hypothetical protein
MKKTTIALLMAALLSSIPVYAFPRQIEMVTRHEVRAGELNTVVPIFPQYRRRRYRRAYVMRRRHRRYRRYRYVVRHRRRRYLIRRRY